MVNQVLDNKIFWHRFRPANEVSKRILGAHPQVTMDQGWYDIEDKTHPGLWMNIWSGGKFPDEFIIPTFHAEPRAKITDFLCSEGIGSSSSTFIVSQRCKDLLDNYRLQVHQFYKTKAYFNDQALDYYIYHFYDTYFDIVDFKKTIFYYDFLADFKGDKKKYRDVEFFINSAAELTIKIELARLENLSIKAKPLVFIQEPGLYDLFYMRSIFFGLFITDDLKNTFIKNKITGWAIISSTEYIYDGIHKYKAY
ncbi:MAG: hypothetical protein IPO92_00415 [Saprospiraceae bacterium]|nr:hypothetical protein [Saprospiraceae bacterium]